MLLLLSSAVFADSAEDVRCREIGFSQSVETSDLERFTSFLDDDARFVGSSVLRGPASITEAWSVFFREDGPKIRWRPQIVEVLEDGKLALTRGPYQLIAPGAGGEMVEQWGTFNSVWRMQPDGQWKVVFDAGSEAGQPPAEEVRALLDQTDSCGQGS
jgi:ketosteroid isomerase-like protein